MNERELGNLCVKMLLVRFEQSVSSWRLVAIFALCVTVCFQLWRCPVLCVSFTLFLSEWMNDELVGYMVCGFRGRFSSIRVDEVIGLTLHFFPLFSINSHFRPYTLLTSKFELPHSPHLVLYLLCYADVIFFTNSPIYL